jgi:phage terminase large subunit
MKYYPHIQEQRAAPSGAVPLAADAVDLSFPEKFQCLFQPIRFKIFKGGRGGAKSWNFARALLLLGYQRPLRILCAREMQKSIKESVHKLLVDQIKSMGLSHFYEVLQSEIRGANGTTFAFEGIRLNAANLKSYEGVDICWVEEAQTVSDQSWRDLIPTIRKERCFIHSDSEPSWAEIWISFNPLLETDPTYKRFVKNTPTNAILQHTTYRDNPWYPKPLMAEIEDLKISDYDEYLHVYEGQCKQNLEGAIYADQMRELTLRQAERAAEMGHAVLQVPHMRGVPVDVIFDIGKSDYTSIWFRQIINWELRFINFHQSNRKDPADHAKIIKDCGYNIGTLWLPHDAKAKRYGSKLTVEEQFRELFPGISVRITPKLSILDGIAAARTVFGNCWFDASSCADGLTALRHYRWEVDPDTKMFSRVPLHDEYSDAADAFRYAAVTSKIRTGKAPLALNLPGGAAPPDGIAAPQGRSLELARPTPHLFGGNDGATGWMRGGG